MATTNISGFSGAGSRTFTLTVTRTDRNTESDLSIRVDVSGESYSYDSYLRVYVKDMETGTEYERINQTASWDSGVWFTSAGKSQTWTSNGWTRRKTTRELRVYIEGYANTYSAKSSYVTITIPTLPQLTVTWNANGGSVGESSKTVYYNDSVGTLPTPIRSGYEFLGWFTSASGGSQITGATKVTNNVTYYAHWKSSGSLRIKVNGNWKQATAYVKVNGNWKQAVAYTKVNGNWKQGG